MTTAVLERPAEKLQAPPPKKVAYYLSDETAETLLVLAAAQPNYVIDVKMAGRFVTSPPLCGGSCATVIAMIHMREEDPGEWTTSFFADDDDTPGIEFVPSSTYEEAFGRLGYEVVGFST